MTEQTYLTGGFPSILEKKYQHDLAVLEMKNKRLKKEITALKAKMNQLRRYL